MPTEWTNVIVSYNETLSGENTWESCETIIRNVRFMLITCFREIYVRDPLHYKQMADLMRMYVR